MLISIFTDVHNQKRRAFRHAFCILIQFFLLLNDAASEALGASRHFECVDTCSEVLDTDLSEFVVEGAFLGNQHYSATHVEQLNTINSKA